MMGMRVSLQVHPFAIHTQMTKRWEDCTKIGKGRKMNYRPIYGFRLVELDSKLAGLRAKLWAEKLKRKINLGEKFKIING